MLFDEKDLNVFDTVDARTYFKEIIQSYYSQNYRATIVLLYSFVIYDLFIKLQTMASEGDRKAENKLKEINGMISDDEKYSKVENEIIAFYKENCSLYFNRFVEDINYLKDCRNKCAHLKVNDNSLYVPSDYHARMLICSMYDNILSVKAPFIMDLFSIACDDVEYYSSTVSYIPSAGLDRTIIEKLDSKYFSRMTYDSIKKSYKTFIKLLFVTDDENCEKNVYGLYTFAYALTDYIIRKGHIRIFNEDIIIGIISNISIEVLKESRNRRKALISIITNFTIIMDLVSKNEDLFEYVTECVFNTPANISMYRMFFPRSEKSAYTFFLENKKLQDPSYTESIYCSLKESDEFNIEEFMKIMVSRIPSYNGFSDADAFMDSFITHMEELSLDSIEEITRTYKRNNQCTNRARHTKDINIVNDYIETLKASSATE